ncbi:BRO family protein, partial [Bacillus toyonensis]|uniref:BRO family protein n=1 Tax=Bacillus toyonensis TaxID=155322 RepID=UPI0020D269A2
MFLAKDVAKWIGYDGRTGQLLKSVDEEEKLTHTIHASGQVRQMWFLTEDGIYEVLMLSRKPIAKQWKKEVKKILKNIRLNGGHVQIDREEEFINNNFSSFSEELKQMMVHDLRAKNKQLQAEVEAKEAILVEQAPKMEEHRVFQDKKGSLNPTEIYNKLRELNQKPDFIRGARSLNEFLKRRGIQYKQGNHWKLYTEYKWLLDEGYAIEIKQEAATFMQNQLRWTPKGYDYIVSLLEEEVARLEAYSKFLKVVSRYDPG